MSRHAHSTNHRSVPLAGIVLTATLAAPAVIQAQGITGEQTLLNRVSPAAVLSKRFGVALSETAPTESLNRIDGATAMLGSNTARTVPQPASARIAYLPAPQSPISGERAFLGRAGPAKSRQDGGE
jgi:hypothetical protein